jgi:hypothetical protein
MHCHLNRIIDQGSGHLESCSSALASKLCFANCNDRAQQEHRCGSVGYALPAADAPVHGVSSSLTIAVAEFGGLPGAEEGSQRTRPHYQ